MVQRSKCHLDMPHRPANWICHMGWAHGVAHGCACGYAWVYLGQVSSPHPPQVFEEPRLNFSCPNHHTLALDPSCEGPSKWDKWRGKWGRANDPSKVEKVTKRGRGFEATSLPHFARTTQGKSSLKSLSLTHEFWGRRSSSSWLWMQIRQEK